MHPHSCSTRSLAALKCCVCRGQARNEVHRMATLLGAALVGHLANLKATLREAEARSREVVQPEHGGRLGGLLHWGRWRRRGIHHEGGGLLCAAPCPCRWLECVCCPRFCMGHTIRS